MLEVSNVRGGMRLAEAGQLDAMRSTCPHRTLRKRRERLVFPRDSRAGDPSPPAASRGKRGHKTAMMGERLTATPFGRKSITLTTDSVASVKSRMRQHAFAGRFSDDRLLKMNAVTEAAKSSSRHGRLNFFRLGSCLRGRLKAIR